MPLGGATYVIPPTGVLSFKSLNTFIVVFFSNFSGPESVTKERSIVGFVGGDYGIMGKFTRLTGATGGVTDVPTGFPTGGWIVSFLVFLWAILPASATFAVIAGLSSAGVVTTTSLTASMPLPVPVPVSTYFGTKTSFAPSPIVTIVFPFFYRTLAVHVLFSNSALTCAKVYSGFSSGSSSMDRSGSYPIGTVSPSSVVPVSFTVTTTMIL